MAGSTYLELLDWRRRVAELFAELRRRPADAATLAWFREEKDALFRNHPQSPIPAEQRSDFQGLAYCPSCTYDPIWVCPLAPPDSRLAMPVRAGEKLR